MLSRGLLNIAELDQAYVAIVQHFTQPQGVIHQVTLRPDKVRGNLIRLGETQGDELVGWNYPANVMVLEILGTAREVKPGEWECVPLDS